MHEMENLKYSYTSLPLHAFLALTGTTSPPPFSELLTTDHEVPGSIPGSTMGIFLVGGGSPW